MQNYTYRFSTEKSAAEVYHLLLDITQWWSGIYAETIAGTGIKIYEEFDFEAGDGMHRTTQKLAELIPNQKIVWQVTFSRLSFLNKPQEWEGTLLIFDIAVLEDKTQVSFTHQGLLPHLECYEQCSGAWASYFQQLVHKLNDYEKIP